jgi:hypothetical protein
VRDDSRDNRDVFVVELAWYKYSAQLQERFSASHDIPQFRDSFNHVYEYVGLAGYIAQSL